MSQLEEEFAFQLLAIGNTGFEREYKFHKKRRWRFDFAWPDLRLAVEIEGGVYSAGRHTRGSGFEKDCEKYNNAALEGWTVLRFTGNMVKNGTAIGFTDKMIDIKTLGGNSNGRENTYPVQ